MASTTTRQQPPWTAPRGTTPHPKLKVYNSLTRTKTPFVPGDPEGKSVTWYACGPTVYDDAHLGHARNYVSTDIIRRILKDYFNFDVNFVMNITDVDDKIILRGRQAHLYDEYKIRNRYITKEVLETVLTAYQTYLRKNLPLIDQEHPPAPKSFPKEIHATPYGRVLGSPSKAMIGEGKPGDDEAKIKMHINTAASAAKALDADLKNYTPDAFYHLVQDVMCPMLDEAFGTSIKGDDHAIFTKLTREFESRFFRDVRELNVMDPDAITRVTEFGQEIADFVERIANNKFAYATSDGSVYFDVNAFETAGNPYARLEPWNTGNEELQAEGEGKLTKKTTEKRSKADFALWKASKAGEPSWPSPWGAGRPGWHIECSAMASAKFGKHMDIHSGGIDLAFPHHDNELAQSEAYWSDEPKEQWVNYFLHMGHLSIAGSKMSKSLKNFTTIRQALDRGDWTPRSLRIVFLMGNWRDGIEITDDLVSAGSSWEDKVDNFFLNVMDATNARLQFEFNKDESLGEELKAVEEKVHEALCDSFNTAVVLASISSLISKYNSADKQLIPPSDILSTAKFVTRMVNILGLNGTASADTDEIGWRGIEIPEAAKPYVYPLSSMRDELREKARSKEGLSKEAVEVIVQKHSRDTTAVSGLARPFAKIFSDFGRNVISASNPVAAANGDSSPAAHNAGKEVLALCDRVRDVDLWRQNIYLEDRDNAPALVRPVTASLAEARKEKEDKASAREAEKLKRKQEEQARAEKGKLSHEDMFKPPNTEEYGSWNDLGLPTRMRDGSEVPKSKNKKLTKLWEAQKKAHEAWLGAKSKENAA